MFRRMQSERPVRLKELLVAPKPEQIGVDSAVLGFVPVLLDILGQPSGEEPASDRLLVVRLQPVTQPRKAASLSIDRLRLNPVYRLFRRGPHADKGCVRAMGNQAADIGSQSASGTDLPELFQGRLDAPAAVRCIDVHILIELSFQLVVLHFRMVRLRVFQLAANSIGN